MQFPQTNFDEKKGDEKLVEEDLFIGNLWKFRKQEANADKESRRCKHLWVMFLSTSPTDIIPPKTVKSVEYQLHPTYVIDKLTKNRPPFILRRSGWGRFNVGVRIIFKNNRNSIFVWYPLQFEVPLASMSLSDQRQFRRHKVDFDKIISRFDKTPPPDIKPYVKTMGEKLNRHMRKLPRALILTDFNQTPETVVEIMGLFFQAYGLPMPEEILQLLVAYSTLHFLSLNAHQALVIKNCSGISIKLKNKGKQVSISNCKDIKLEVEDLINFVEIFNSENVEVTVIGDTGVNSYKLEQSSDIRIRFRDDSSMITFIDQFSKGLVQAAPFSKGEEMLEFKDMKNSFRFPVMSSRTRWSTTRGWTNTILTNRMRAALS